MPELTAHSIPTPHPLPPSLYAAPPSDPPDDPPAPPVPPAGPPPPEPSGPENSSQGAATPPPASPPVIDPAKWEDFPTFRETFLAYFTRPEDAAAFRHIGNLVFEMVLEHCRYFPDPPESDVRRELRAALADLRHLQGFLRTLGNQRKASSLGPEDTALSRYAAKQSGKVRRLTDRIEQRLAVGS
jgi:hypothetical protein